ncbi:hypothetical protein MMC28_006265 [Mycoblastus sanguinarius]|nr:hypothetical protein [Mycoblastus sanguinarius]
MPSDVAQSYEHLTHHVVPGPNSISYFIPFLLLPTALLIPPTILSHQQLGFVFLPLIYACNLHAWSVGGIEVISVTLTLWSFVLLVLRDPRKTHTRVWVSYPLLTEKAVGEPAEEIVEEPYPEKLSKRIPWVFTLLVSLRLTGWKIGDPSHDKTQPPRWLSRSLFCKHAGITILQSYVILDTAACYVQTDPYFSTSNMSVDAPFPPPYPEMPTLLVILRLLPPRLLRSSVLAGQTYAMVTGMFFLPTLPAVGFNALGLLPDEWSPHTWPVFFGNFSSVWQRGLRGLWGSWWHQNNRHITATPGRSLTQALGIPTASTLGFALLTLSAFFFSGVLHIGMIPPEPQNTPVTASTMRLYIAAFFWAQIPAFGIEIVVSKVVARFVPHIVDWSMTKACIVAWAAAWLSLTLPLLTVPFREIGYWNKYPVPVSPLQGLSGQGWVAW